MREEERVARGAAGDETPGSERGGRDGVGERAIQSRDLRRAGAGAPEAASEIDLPAGRQRATPRCARAVEIRMLPGPVLPPDTRIFLAPSSLGPARLTERKSVV